MKSMWKTGGALTLLLLTISACSVHRGARESADVARGRYPARADASARGDVLDRVIDLGKSLVGKPYLHRVDGSWALDCSGFVGYIFARNGIDLPRSSTALYHYARRVESPRRGDLLFFRGRNRRSARVGHVALVIDVQGSRVTMMHSASRGVIIEVYNDSRYYVERYLGAGRIPALEAGASGR